MTFLTCLALSAKTTHHRRIHMAQGPRHCDPARCFMPTCVSKYRKAPAGTLLHYMLPSFGEDEQSQ
jgi:hypothetical protein